MTYVNFNDNILLSCFLHRDRCVFIDFLILLSTGNIALQTNVYEESITTQVQGSIILPKVHNNFIETVINFPQIFVSFNYTF